MADRNREIPNLSPGTVRRKDSSGRKAACSYSTRFSSVADPESQLFHPSSPIGGRRGPTMGGCPDVGSVPGWVGFGMDMTDGSGGVQESTQGRNHLCRGGTATPSPR